MMKKNSNMYCSKKEIRDKVKNILVLNKDLDWQKKLVYCLDNQRSVEELNIICKLISFDDEELFEMCIDALRAFDNELGRSFMKKNSEIIIEVEKRMVNKGYVTKRVLEDFLEKFV
ncbi:hypothetical protein [Anaerosacchariphilus polymeriproducens]|uniref:hypothetical protein n=1 Tax=Anaerosacchariphilus polymeriproducens TaxID=1812858 RepID=UPI00187B9596|nr:hypothetical protein [Anaerosacchariphilus polymeriproducens]